MVEARRVEVNGTAGFDLPDGLPPPLARLLNYWKSQCPGEGGLPRKEQFDPLDLDGLWHDLSVLQISARPASQAEILIRYAGEHLDSMHGVSLAGKHLRSVIDETEARRSIPSLVQAAVEGAPHYRSGHRPHRQQGTVAFERLFVPFRAAKGDTAYLVGIWYWPQPAPRGVLRMGDGVHMISSRPPVLD